MLIVILDERYKIMKKKIVAFAMVFALAAVAVVGGSLAYFTDTDAKENTFTVGNVKIALIEQQNGDNELVDFENDKQLMPGAENAVDKIVSVENTGGNDAYIRVKITVPSDLAEVIHLVFEDDYTSTWNEVTSETDNSGKVYTAVYKTAIASGESTSHLLSKVYLDERVDMRLDENNNQEYFYTVTTEEGDAVITEDVPVSLENIQVDVVAEAIQADGFDNAEDAFAAFDAQ